MPNEARPEPPSDAEFRRMTNIELLDEIERLEEIIDRTPHEKVALERAGIRRKEIMFPADLHLSTKADPKL